MSSLLIIVLGLFATAVLSQPQHEALRMHVAKIGNGITLHYVDEGSGVPLVFVHGSLSDLTYWFQQIGPLSKHYRVIAYSRRYNDPNVNPPQPGYSAVVDSDDLAALIQTLHLGKVVVSGHSYGALTALFLATRHPELVRALVLAEPPAISLLLHVHGNEAARSKAMFEDIQQRMVAPMQRAFRKDDREQGVRIFIDYVFNDPHAWEQMSPSSRADTLKDAHEWDVMMTTGTLFPEIKPEAIQRISVPVLIFSGGKSYPFLGVIDQELSHLLPNNKRIIFPNDGHQMWFQDAQTCRHDLEAFLENSEIR